MTHLLTIRFLQGIDMDEINVKLTHDDFYLLQRIISEHNSDVEGIIKALDDAEMDLSYDEYVRDTPAGEAVSRSEFETLVLSDSFDPPPVELEENV
tara:strand:- start:368 stop:655 length:288 start_codon:yes stop_codon:yes gene_type:complete